MKYSQEPITESVMQRANYLKRCVVGSSCHGPTLDVDVASRRSAELYELVAAVQESSHEFDVEIIEKLESWDADVKRYANALRDADVIVGKHRESVGEPAPSLEEE